jgi:rhodanese-related sulfurtransferase
MKKTLFLCAVILCALASSVRADDLRVSREWLLKQMGAQEVTILDVRQPYDWNSSPNKIKGAIRRDPNQVDDWLSELSKNKVYVLYCA